MVEDIKEIFYVQGKDFNKDHVISKQVNFEWNIIYACNFRCPHCIFDGKWEEYSPRTIYKNVKEWMRLWNTIFDKYGRSSILITGGEPFIYPDFSLLIEELARVHYPINISTNGSGDVRKFIRNESSTERVSFEI